MGTRQEIVQYLELRQAATPAELSRSLGLTAANIRYHLRKMEADGIIYSAGMRLAVERGRPTRVFRLARQAGGLEALTRALLQSQPVSSGDSPEETDFSEVARRLAGRVGSGPEPIPRRLLRTVNRMNDLGYQAHWEAHARAPQIILGNCPYAAIIADHPELCRLDADLLEALLGEAVRQASKLEPNRQGLPICIFRIRA